jgi:MarC family membrane protein
MAAPVALFGGRDMVVVAEYFKLFVALVAIVDIPGNIPVYLQQTEKFAKAEMRIAAISAGIATGTVLLFFALLGELLLATFGITLAAFKILGGIVIIAIALELLGIIKTAATTDAIDVGQNPVAVGIFPLAVPLFAGPGAIAAVIAYGHEHFHAQHDLIMTLVIMTVATAVAAGLLAANAISRYLSDTAHKVMNRLLGIVVGSLGVEFILEGIAAFFPG